MNDPLEIGAEHDGLRDGFRVVANDTSSGRPWMWYFKTMEECVRLAEVLAHKGHQEVDILKYCGSVRIAKPPTEFIKATDWSE